MEFNTPTDYTEAPSLENCSLDGKTSFTLSGKCGKCDKDTIEPRGYIKKFPGGCFVFDYAAVCYDCKTITPYSVRWYPEQKRFVQSVNGIWVETFLVPKTKWNVFKIWFHNLINRIKGR